ncbi:SusC/RagA family TonB-linked outer membrane protein [Agriterribacter humi]|jgi:TonB-linked SusC/RagA family outer membrane protein|uniref:SusC/RagA family TonB-linked outer membrane protein n=1 Tax=Agriterribacter humi TaxID=1104781 RepID=UPI00126573C5|nr:TonB-dependent receptor [Agriterribacter humi]
MHKKLRLFKAFCDLWKPGRYSFLIPALLLLFSAGTLSAQSVKVSGVVKTSGQEPLASVSIKVKNSQIGTMTDVNGRFSLEVPGSQSVLVFTYVGFTEKSVVVGNQNAFDVTMEENGTGLAGVVVVGYGNKTRKATLTSSISAIKGDKLIEAVPNIANKLSGRVTGILSYQTSGESGLDETTIRIRGQNTIGNSAPLIIIDGIPGQMSSVNSEDIEDISVLKDAAAAAPYGLAAANGVILITTKKGVKGGAKLSYNANLGFQNPVYLTKTLNSYQQALMQNEIYLNDHPNDTNVPWSESELEEYRKVSVGDPTGNYDKYFNSNNLHDVIRHDYPISNQNFSIRGGSENITYYGSLGYFNQASMIPTENFQRYYGVLNLDADLNKSLKVSLGVRMDRGIRKWPSFGSQITDVFGIYGRMYEIAPDDAIWYPNTDGFWARGRFDFNPAGRIYTSGQSTNKADNTLYSVGLEQKLPLKGLSIKGVFNYGTNNTFGEAWNTDPIYWDVDNTVTPAVYTKRLPTSKPGFAQNYLRSNTITAQGFLNYDRIFGEHAITALFVTEARDLNTKSFYATKKNYSILIPTLDMGSSVQTDIGNGGTATQARQFGLVAKLDYRYQDKYMIGFSGRRDQHYYFAPGFRTGYFPAVSAGWRIGQEKFIKNKYAWINELKLRGSWGQSGNLAGDPYQYLSTYGISNEIYRLGGQLGTGLYERSPANPSITWEKQKQTNIGVDVVLWNGLLSFSADYFYQIRDNMLLNPDVTIPAEYGITLPQENAGKMSNRGFELTAGTRKNFANGITFDINANFSFARNKLLRIFENPATYNDPNRRRTGNQLGAQYGLVALGYFQTQEEVDNSPVQNFGTYTVGDVKYADLNKDGIVDATDEKKIGYPNFPESIFGLNLAVSWKGFDISALIQGATLMSVNRPGAAGGGAPGNSNGNTQVEALDHWTPQTPNAKFPRWSYLSSANNFRTSTHTMRNNTYIRLKGFNVGYTIPAGLLKKIRVGSARFYVSGQNLFTWTAEYLNSDPESAAGGAYRFANQKSVSFGVSLSF